MPKVVINEDEWYPVWVEDKHYGKEIEMTDEELASWKKVEEAFDYWQAIVGKRYKAASWPRR